jgi:hypothetical protein
VAEHDGATIAVEVKTIASLGPLAPIPEDAFTDHKALTVRRLAMKLNPQATRVDLVAVSLDVAGARVRWLRGAG